IVPEQEALWRELLRDPRTARARLDACRSGGGVDLEDLVHLRQVDACGAAVATSSGMLDAADHVRAAPIGNEGDGVRLAAPEQRDELRLVRRVEDPVGSAGEVAREAAHEVAEPAPVRVGRALAEIGRSEAPELDRRRITRLGKLQRLE